MKKNKEQRKIGSWLSTRWFLGVVFIVFMLIGISLVKELFRSHQINNEIEQLEQQIASLEQNKQHYQEFVEYLKTDRYLEEQARLKLGLKSPGEHMLIIADEKTTNETTKQLNSGILGSLDKEIEYMSNPEKWLAYFLSDY